MVSAIPVVPVFAKIISGGQTGVDRAALDAALKHGIDCGGWCPAGRVDELGKIPERYPVTELARAIKEGRSPGRPSGGGSETAAPWGSHGDIFAERTWQNVTDSDGTVIIYFAELRGGSKQTVEFCRREKRPHRLIDATKFSVEEAAKSIREFVREKNIRTLNVAGPRESEWKEGYDYAFSAIDLFLSFFCSGGL